MLRVFVEMHAEGPDAERHEYSTGTEVYCSEQQAGHAEETRMIPSSSLVLNVARVTKRGPEVVPGPLLRRRQCLGPEGAVTAFVSPANGQSSRLTSVRFRSLQILHGMFVLISIPPPLGDCCIRMIELYRAQVTVSYVT